MDKMVAKLEPGHRVVEKVPGCTPAVIGNERERIVRLVPGSMEGNWLRLEVISPSLNGDDTRAKVVALSDEEWLRVANWVNKNFIKPEGWTP